MDAVDLEARLAELERGIHAIAADLDTPPRVVARELAELERLARRLRVWLSRELAGVCG